MNVPSNKFKAALANGQLQIGLWSSLASNGIAELLSDSGVDWIVLDTEHAPNETTTLVSQLQAMATGTASAIVRPAWNDVVLIKRILDIGAQSLVIPFVQNEAEAKAAVAATRYPPDGVRGAAGSSRAARYGRIKNYLQEAANEIAIIAQVESATALNNLEAIASVPGIDGVFIGPSDLSASLGHLGNPKHETVQSAIKTAVDQLRNLGTPAGILAFNPDDAQRYIEWGYQFVAVGSDVSILSKGAQALATRFK